jgi:hypothetical protein
LDAVFDRMPGDIVGVTAADLAQIPMSPDLGATLSRGAEFAAGAGASDVALEHLLAALCDDSDAIAVLDASNVNVAALKSDVVGQFTQAGADPEQAPTSLGVSPDVRRILEAAAAAARGSRRRDINGAIVLAAIVGDARSVAADILQAHGLTFDSAIRALQAALASAPTRAPAAQPPVADDVLARARERVQSRSTPTLRDLMKDMPQPVPPPPPSAIPAAARGGEPVHPQSRTAEPEPSQAEAAPATPSGPEPAPEDEPRPQFESEPQRGHPAPGLSLDLPERPIAQPSVRGTLPGQSHAPAPPERVAHPAAPPTGPSQVQGQSQHGQGFPGDLPRPRPMGGPPPPIPVPVPAATGMRAPFPGPALSAPSPVGPSSIGQSGALQTDSGLRADARGDQLPAGAPAAVQPPPKEKNASRKRAKNAKTETGQLAENIPRTMRVGKTERVEIRIAKASIKSLAENLDGGGAVWQHQVTVTKAMAVRMRAPDGGFFIETASPETQWIENNLGYGAEDYASWRFLVTPQSKGWSQLQIVVSARTIGADGVAAETALPDQVIEVKVKRNLKRTFARMFSWTVAAIIGGALSTFGETGLATVRVLLSRLIQ